MSRTLKTSSRADFVSLHDEEPLQRDHDLCRITNKALTRTFDHSWIEPARHSFRVSSFPYCPIVDLHDRVHEITAEETFGKAFYTNVGTTVHEKLMQTYMLFVHEYGDYVYGSWKCRRCELQVGPCTHKKGKQRLRLKTKDTICQQKGCDYEYVELLFEFGAGGSGHLDMLMKLPGRRWLAWEFKTTGSFLFNSPPNITRRYYPDSKHKVQIQTYCALLKLCYGIMVNGYSIVYINRDKVELNSPKKTGNFGYVNQGKDRWGFKSYTYIWNQSKQQLFESRLATAEKGRTLLDKLVGRETPDAALVAKLVQLKPCTSRKTYQGYMDAKFFGEKSCSYYKNGKCFKDEVMEREVISLHGKLRKVNAVPIAKHIKKAERSLLARKQNEEAYSPSAFNGSSFAGVSVARVVKSKGSDTRTQLW